MLDTNIMVDLLRVQWRRDKKIKLTKELEKADYLGRAAGRLYNRYASTTGLLEFRDKLEQYLHTQKVIGFGYLPHELRDAKKDIPLEKEELNLIRRGVTTVFSPSILKNPTIEPERLLDICMNGLTLIDATLLLQASKTEGCDYFVTGDKRLLQIIANNKLKKNFKSLKIKYKNDFYGILKRMEGKKPSP